MYQNKSLAIWLFSVCALIVAMIVIGAVTRLTESGLSIVEWHAVTDMLPPLSHNAWATVFAEYKHTPQYIKENHGMTLDQFKEIYFWEWLHRFFGRLIGLAYALPLAYFWLTKKIPNDLKPRFAFFLFLGGLQGAIGWYMVKSGLVDMPRVSHLRLALHLVTALLLLVLLWAQALTLWPPVSQRLKNFSFKMPRSMRTQIAAGFILLVVTMIWGAFTAGLRAGLACSDFPQTCSQWVPQELFFKGRFWHNIVFEPTSVQYVHRVFATLTFLTLFTLGLRLIRTREPSLKRLGFLLHILILLQFLLGVATVQSHVLLPLAATHQFNAVLNLLVITAIAVFARPAKPSRS